MSDIAENPPTEPTAPPEVTAAAEAAPCAPAEAAVEVAPAPEDAAAAEPQPAPAPEADAPVAPEGDATVAAETKPAVPELSPAACAALLAQHYPALFGAGKALPIKLRIQADIQTRTPGLFTKKTLSIFLHRHTTSTAYLKALVALPQRYDLDGAPAGEVAQEHRDAAAAEVERRRAIVDARRQAERDAQRQAQRARAPVVEATAAADGSAPTAPMEGAAPALPPMARPPRPPFKPNDPRAKAARREGRPPAGPRPEGRAAQPPRQGRPPQGDRPPRADRPPRPDGPRPPRHDMRADQRQEPRPPAEAPLPPGLSAAEIEARRDRANLLRAWEGSTLTRANFCVLKRIKESDLDTALKLAQEERGPRPPRPTR